MPYYQGRLSRLVNNHQVLKIVNTREAKKPLPRIVKNTPHYIIAPGASPSHKKDRSICGIWCGCARSFWNCAESAPLRPKWNMSRGILLEITSIVRGVSFFSSFHAANIKITGSTIMENFSTHDNASRRLTEPIKFARHFLPETVLKPTSSDSGHVLVTIKADALRRAFLKSYQQFCVFRQGAADPLNMKAW